MSAAVALPELVPHVRAHALSRVGSHPGARVYPRDLASGPSACHSAILDRRARPQRRDVRRETPRAGYDLATESLITRDSVGRIATKTEQVGAGAAVVFGYGYDAAGRLVEVTRDGVVSEAYSHDANGNRTSADYPLQAISRAAVVDEQDRLESYGSWTYSYTAHGELESRSAPDELALAYDPFGALRSAEVDASGTPVVYDADALGRRIRSTEGATHLGSWLWRSALQPVAQLDASNAVTHRYVYGGGVNVPDLVVEIAGGGRWRLIKDHLGSARLVVDIATGTVLRDVEWDAFGRVLASAGTLDLVPFGFAGGLWDADTGLVRFGARDYDPETGRWLAKDPIRFRGGVNLYAYAENDPVNRRDPSGLYAGPDANLILKCLIGLGLGGAAAGGAAEALVATAAAAGALYLAGDQAYQLWDLCDNPEPEPEDDGGMCPDESGGGDASNECTWPCDLGQGRESCVSCCSFYKGGPTCDRACCTEDPYR